MRTSESSGRGNRVAQTRPEPTGLFGNVSTLNGCYHEPKSRSNSNEQHPENGIPKPRRHPFKPLALLGAVVLLVPALLCAAAPVPPQVTNTAPLVFGTLIAAATAGTVTISPAGAQSTTGGVIALAGAFGAAQFTIQIDQGNPNYTIILPASTTLTGPGTPMTVDTFVSNPSAGGQVSHAVSEPVTVGATLHIGANQTPGDYSGTFLLTITNP
jgi:Domain of unknown function (DUF4402)